MEVQGKRICVLMSAYNGEKYIEEQIESIMAQTYKNLEIYVRDDGSKDHTLQILQDYEAKGRIKLEAGNNIGFIKSFLWLVAHSTGAEYYAYSDQDDVWLENKIEMALEKLADADDTKPVLYFSNYDYYDGTMNFMEHGSTGERKSSFPNCLVDCISLGFNSVLNRTAHDMIAANTPQYACGHDWWTYMVCQGMGQVIYDERATVKYRRHEANVSAGGMDFIKFQIWRFKKFFVNDYFKNVRQQLREYEMLYADQLSGQDQKTLQLFTRDRYYFATAWKKVLFTKRFRQGMIDEIMVRILFLIGRL